MLVIVLVVLVALIAAGGVSAYTFLTRDEPVVYGNIVEQYKYGSIGTEELQGIPYELWVVLPEVFADLLPPGQGKGYERFGFLYEPGHETPIGTTSREKPIDLLGLNCALCHVGTYRDDGQCPPADGPRDAVQQLAALGLHRVPAESQARRALQRRHAARGDRAPLPRQALVLRPAVLALRRHSADEGRARGSRPGLRVARQSAPVRARPRRHVQPAEATRGLRHGGRPHGGDGRLPLDLGTAHADRDVPPLGRQQRQPARAEPLRRASGRRDATTPSTSTSSTGSRTGCSTCRRPPFRGRASTRSSRAAGRRSTASSAPRATTSAARVSAR